MLCHTFNYFSVWKYMKTTVTVIKLLIKSIICTAPVTPLMKACTVPSGCKPLLVHFTCSHLSVVDLPVQQRPATQQTATCPSGYSKRPRDVMRLQTCLWESVMRWTCKVFQVHRSPRDKGRCSCYLTALHPWSKIIWWVTGNDTG